MRTLFRSLNRRSLLKFLIALPALKAGEKFFNLVFGAARTQAWAAAPVRVARVSDLKQPWSAVRFTYAVKVKTRDVYKKDGVGEESVPGVVIRLPDELAEKRGGGVKGGLYVANLHCTHQRCETAYLTDKAEIYAMSGIEKDNPVAYCPCHRSLFDLAADGKPIKGPARDALWKFEFDVKGDEILVTGLDPKASVWEPGRAGGLTSEYPVRPGEPGL